MILNVFQYAIKKENIITLLYLQKILTDYIDEEHVLESDFYTKIYRYYDDSSSIDTCTEYPLIILSVRELSNFNIWIKNNNINMVYHLKKKMQGSSRIDWWPVEFEILIDETDEQLAFLKLKYLN